MNTRCALLHPQERNLCPDGAACVDFECQRTHPSSRVRKCTRGDSCTSKKCDYLHPSNWDPLALKSQQSILKSQETRDEERKKANLPILQSKDDFIKRLRQNKVLVVTAETGSGKTTQLPQYCAESFSGLVICTQPRAIAAMTIAQRISDEFDGSSTGANVGYKIGRGKSQKGRRIMLMTDASLIQLAQSDPLLKCVSVLIIDEAHERSLNTDIVVGIAKIVQRQRPQDFHVVIASATIDPKPFIEFFADAVASLSRRTTSLSVPGRKFEVTKENKDLEDDQVLNPLILVENVVKALETHKEGNCLVFLPGSTEVDKALRRFKVVAQKEWIGLPLYGSLPPEEQARVMSFDDEGGTLRMVVFCTNVAETSLTVPNTRLVIDTGLAKEARFDPARRMTILEQVYISKSSAKQRQGRAGRTSAGYCLRLYSEEKLERESVQPEILRSSLDTVVLTLCRLGQDPRTFPLLDRPPVETINASLEMLERLGCLEPGSVKITARGRLFSELPFDPRLSSFVTQAHTQYQAGSLAAEIAAILSAPGSIFFTGGSTKEMKDAAKRKIAEASSAHLSDLVFLRSIYRNWEEAGKTSSEGRCLKCNRSVARYLGGCRGCRVSYSNKAGLNNKILEIVRTTVDQVMKTVTRASLDKEKNQPNLTESSDEEIIGRCIAASFPEQIGELLVNAHPDSGVFLLASETKGDLAPNSAVTQNLLISAGQADDSQQRSPKLVIAMSATKLPSGVVLLDRLHRIQESWLPVHWQRKLRDLSLDVVRCYHRPNLGPQYQKQLHKYFISQASAGIEWTKFLICKFDSKTNAINVYCPRSIQHKVAGICQARIDAHRKQDLEWDFQLSLNKGKGASVTLTSGLRIEHIEDVGQACRVCVNDPPCDSEEEFETWIKKKAGITAEDIKWIEFAKKKKQGPTTARDSGHATIMLRNKTAASAVLRSISDGEGTAKKMEDWGRSVTWLFAESIEDVKTLVSTMGLKGLPKISETKPVFKIILNNVRSQVTSESINSILGPCKPNKIVSRRRDPKAATHFLVLEFSSPSVCDSALTILQASAFATEDFPINFMNKKGKLIEKGMKKEVQPGKIILNHSFPSSEEADRFYYTALQSGRGQPSGQAFTKVQYADLHPTLAEIASDAAGRFGVKHHIRSDRDSPSTKTVTFNSGPPSKCGQAAQLLFSSVAPLRIRLTTRQQQLLMKHLYESNQLEKWEAELRVVTNLDIKHGNICRYEVYGPPFQQVCVFLLHNKNVHNLVFCRANS